VTEAAIVPYRVVYSERVRLRVRSLAKIAFERGDGEAFLAAVAEFHRRLAIYPQFGEPLMDLSRQSGRIWIATVPPVTMRYAVFEELRLVAIGALPVLSPPTKPRPTD
jgi:hypothetical protein